MLSKKKTNKHLTIATALIMSRKKYSNESRTKLLKNIISNIKDHVNVVLLPAGYYKVQGKADKLYKYAINNVKTILSKSKSNMIVCFGVDGIKGSKTPDQMALAVSRKGLIALGRKFYPTDDEEINKASDFQEKERGYNRQFVLKGKVMYLAVCNDAFGIRKIPLTNPGVDIVFDLIHVFNPHGVRGCSTGFFARHGLAGASKRWKVPVFASAVFINRSIPEKWPSGVVWNRGGISTRFWKYVFNPLKHDNELSVEGKNGEDALIRIFNHV